MLPEWDECPCILVQDDLMVGAEAQVYGNSLGVFAGRS